jgi:hypothetical protein
MAEGADDPYGIAGRHAVEDGFQPAAPLVLVAWNRIEVCRMRSTRSNTSAPSWSRTVSPIVRPAVGYPSAAVPLLQRQRLVAAIDRASVSEGMVWEDTIWEDMAGYS